MKAPDTELLMVDDDEMTLFIQQKILERCNFPMNFHAFRSAEKCLTYMREHQERCRFVLLLDINMPGMSGWDMLDQLTNELKSCEVQVIMATSSVDYDDRRRAEEYACVHDFIEKPFSLNICESLKAVPHMASALATE